jgi:hypothetical protein
MKMKFLRNWRWWTFTTFAVMLVWLIGDSQSFQECITNVSIMLGRDLRCLGTFLQNNNGTITTLATVVMAIFTYFLYASTDKLWKAGQDALKATERAFISLDEFKVELANKGLHVTRFAVQPRWRNSGNTPTRYMTIRIGSHGPIGPIPPDYDYRNSPEPFFVPPKAVEPSAFIEIQGANDVINNGTPHSGLVPNLFLWGRADYNDIFGQSHFFEWCYQIRFECHNGKKLRAGFIQYGDYNRTD